MSLQGRWKHSREEIISQTVGKYADLAPSLALQLTTLLNSAPALSKGAAAQIVSARLGRLGAVPQTSEKYWLQRGWSQENAILKARERKLAGIRKTENIKSPFGAKHWLEKINPETGQQFTSEEADFQRNSRRPIRKEYWMARDKSEIEAGQLARKTKDKNNRNGGTKDSVYALRTVGYYLVRGHSNEDAKRLLAEAQTTFSLEKLVNKYGEAEGAKRWQARQDIWQNTLNAKSFEEQEDINQRKIWKSGSMSKVSQQLFEQINIPGARWGKKTKINAGEMMIELSKKRRVMIDFSFEQKLIEFHGDYWHANPSKYKPEDIIITRRTGPTTAKDIWETDSQRAASLSSLGYQLLIVWEHDFKTNPQETIEKCKAFLNS